MIDVIALFNIHMLNAYVFTVYVVLCWL